MTLFNKDQKSLAIAFGILIIIFAASSIYSYSRIQAMSTQIDTLSSNLSTLSTEAASTSQRLESTINQIHISLSNALNAEKKNVGAIQQQLGGVQTSVGTLSGNLYNLQKLANTDPELLKKYSKVYFLNENYVPAHLSEIPQIYLYSNTKQLLFQSNALPHLQSMMEAASTAGVKLYVQSAYRSFAEQRALKGNYSVVYGAGTANSFSADQGYSEHQLGTTVDMITPGLGGVLDGFDTTSAYQWMLDNAYKYGFVLSYPKNNGYYVFEPWHWRFVGTKLAGYLHTQGKNFYDLDQRTIDTYLTAVFD